MLMLGCNEDELVIIPPLDSRRLDQHTVYGHHREAVGGHYTNHLSYQALCAPTADASVGACGLESATTGSGYPVLAVSFSDKDVDREAAGVLGHQRDPV
jgi:hypothetical protein